MYSKKKEPIPTGSCLILITPDSERTMCTFLGTAGKINEKDVNENIIKKSDLIFLRTRLTKQRQNLRPIKVATRAKLI